MKKSSKKNSISSISIESIEFTKFHLLENNKFSGKKFHLSYIFFFTLFVNGMTSYFNRKLYSRVTVQFSEIETIGSKNFPSINKFPFIFSRKNIESYYDYI